MMRKLEEVFNGLRSEACLFQPNKVLLEAGVKQENACNIQLGVRRERLVMHMIAKEVDIKSLCELHSN